MRKASDSDVVPFRVRTGVAALSIILGVATLVGVPAVALADAESGNGPAGDGTLHLMPEVITNSSTSAGGSTDFPILSRLFLSEMTGRARELAAERSKVSRAIDEVTFTSHASQMARDPYAHTRAKLFDDYSPRAIVDADVQASTSSTDIRFVGMTAAGVAAAVLAGFLGLKVAKRRAKRHA